MNASEARKITEKAKENNVGIESILESIYERIKVCASKGENKLFNPFSLRNGINYEQEDRVIKALRSQGYKYHYGKGNQFDYEDPYISW